MLQNAVGAEPAKDTEFLWICTQSEVILQWLLGVYAKDTNQGEYDELFGNRILTAINSETGLEQNAALSTGEKMAAYPPLTTYNK